MSFMGLFPNERERRLAQEEAKDAIDRYGDKAAMVLLIKAQQSRSPTRRMIYRLARKIVLAAS